MSTHNRLLLVTILVMLATVAMPGCNVLAPGPEGAARVAFEEWAKTAGVPYKDVTVQILTNDGAFATARITARFREQAAADWLEKYADVECRHVGDKWQAQARMSFQVTPAEGARQAATATAVQQAQQRASQTATAVAVEEQQSRRLVHLEMGQRGER